MGECGVVVICRRAAGWESPAVHGALRSAAAGRVRLVIASREIVFAGGSDHALGHVADRLAIVGLKIRYADNLSGGETRGNLNMVDAGSSRSTAAPIPDGEVAIAAVRSLFPEIPATTPNAAP